MPSRLQQSIPLPASLVNSTIAMAPVLCGLLAHDYFVSGSLGIGSMIVAMFCVQNILLSFFWRRMKSEFVKLFILYLSVVFQWGYVAAITAAMTFGWNSHLGWVNIIAFGICASGLALFSLKLGSERAGSSALFSLLGLAAAAFWGWSALNNTNASLSAHSFGREHSKNANSDDLPAMHKSGHQEWSYSGDNGPNSWAALKDDFATCSSGKQQSPVDIPRHTFVSKGHIEFHYVPEPAKIILSGHNVQVNLGNGSKIDISGHEYVLKQFHFHTPSEHTVNGLMYPLEAHFVHSDANGKLAVLGVLVERGTELRELASMIKPLAGRGTETQIDIAQIDPMQLLPKDKSAWQYDGSLTTPPCAEGVAWNVFASPVELSDVQISVIRTLFPMNARPTQPLNDRSFETRLPTLAH